MKLRLPLEKFLPLTPFTPAAIGLSESSKRIDLREKLKANSTVMMLLVTEVLKSISVAIIGMTSIIVLWFQSLFVIVLLAWDFCLMIPLNILERLNLRLIARLQKILQ